MSVSNQPLGNEPSMDEILASIRRIIRNDEPPVQVPPAAPEATQAPESVIMLDASMMVPDDEPPAEAPSARAPLRTPAREAFASSSTLSTAPPPLPFQQSVELSDPSATPPDNAGTDQPYEPSAEPEQKSGTVEAPQPIIGARTAEAVSAQFGALVRTISADRSLAVTRGGPTVEEIVREEIRPMLKSWMDSHLPSLVERMVRAEIERVVGRDGG
ncbi:DUF2497 domain-containing protein [Acidiphilium sp. AL]|uniref:DUF2497 domain-containing protein n=1 Tax=Acidiphilium iwatense TaxID=768198 RepID=A0ABS9DY22_9PROT|nr:MULTISPECIES: DUF2497 domain-containing protein [Acidiphilium]MCF3947641.1 DUF2497 domain-containing protein [Acidiphilium iwatense]MCU4160892.1 DUF2497 domain-containing protein [Acidiphilium sp. AL]